MRVVFHGVRGSTPAPGVEFARVGGHTSCVSVWHSNERAPRLVLDAGTGLRHLSPMLADAPFRGTILVTHLHWDHVYGLPFFGAGDRADATVRLIMPEQGDALEVLSRAMSPPHFPITPDQLQGTWTFDGLDEGVHEIEGFSVTAVDVPHKGGRTFGYRVESNGRSFVYLPDHATCLEDGSTREPSESVLALLDGADVLAHDSQFTDADHETAWRYGHATISDAIALAEKADVARLVLFHHAPARSDHEVALLTAQAAARTSVEVIAAMEGLALDV